MSIWIDQPMWPRWGTVFAHLISDVSYAELHDFAASVGISRRAFDGDHYDIPHERFDEAVAAGAVTVDGHELVRRLVASGLRIRKRRGERALVSHRDVRLHDGERFTVDVIAGPKAPPCDPRTGAAAVFVRDADGRFAVVHSVRRGVWGAPGGGREEGESDVECAVREVWEETGLSVDPEALQRCGFERITFADRPSGRWMHMVNYAAVFAVTLAEREPVLRLAQDDVDAVEWVDLDEFERRCSGEFWWPLVEHLFGAR
ncbi:DUF4031 domain-containing protein [Lapillicoccus sp.]|uniref:DUF4031 domain-containing protein n=1 Tax=Lapillicoccus sp. TaxID=1909287 RepID=UPI00398315AB